MNVTNEILFKLLDVSAARRASYATRAGLALGATSILASGGVVLLRGAVCPSPSVWNWVVIASSTAALILILGTFFYAMRACVTHRGPSRVALGCSEDIPQRLFLSPTETFQEFDSRTKQSAQRDFVQRARGLDDTSITDVLIGQLYIDMRVELARYKHLRTAFYYLRLAIVCLLVAGAVGTLEPLVG